MNFITTDDGVRLAYEEAGAGFPLIFVHEFAGDMGSWEPQMRAFARRYRCISYGARGYPPSDVPADPGAYSYIRAVDDIAAVMRGLGVARAHVVGLSMGAYASLHFAMRHPDLAASIVAAGVGYGSAPGATEAFRAESEANAARFRAEGMAAAAATYGRSPSRIIWEAKDPRGFAEFLARLAGHSAEGSALTMLGVQRLRPSLLTLVDALAGIRTPTLIVAGDEDAPSLEPSLFLKRTIPTAALTVLPRTGHAINLEEPDAFNRVVGDFLAAVDAGRWAVPV